MVCKLSYLDKNGCFSFPIPQNDPFSLLTFAHGYSADKCQIRIFQHCVVNSKIFSDCICVRMRWNLGELGIFGILKIPFNEWVVWNLFGIGLLTTASSPGIELVKLLNQEPHQRYLCYGEGVNKRESLYYIIYYGYKIKFVWKHSLGNGSQFSIRL